MLKEWRLRHFEMYGDKSLSGDPETLLTSYLGKQPWYMQQDEYSQLFELLYDLPSQRREYIECCLKDATPSWGYIYLVNLLANKVFNTVFTTNFDDLLNEACYLFSDTVRPIVCAHDSSIQSIRITAHRPKIIKLHGDFLFDNIKNTVTELESLETNTRDKFKQWATEFGLIVVGYAGNDRSVMEVMNTLLRSDQNFPEGVYWCVRKDTVLSKEVEAFRRFPKFKLIEIAGFDEFFADLHEALGLTLQPEMSDPYAALVTKLNRLLRDAKVPEDHVHKVIERDIKAIGRKIAEFSGAVPVDGKMDITLNVDGTLVKMPVPYELLSQIKQREGSYAEAANYLIKELSLRPTADKFQAAFNLVGNHKLTQFTAMLIGLLRASAHVLVNNPGATLTMCLPLISAGFYADAENILDLGYALHIASPNVPYKLPFYHLNKLQIKAHQGQAFTDEEQRLLAEYAQANDTPVRMGASILIGDFEKAESALAFALSLNMLGSDAKEWPIFKLLIPHLKNKEIFDVRSPSPLAIEAASPTPMNNPKGNGKP